MTHIAIISTTVEYHISTIDSHKEFDLAKVDRKIRIYRVEYDRKKVEGLHLILRRPRRITVLGIILSFAIGYHLDRKSFDRSVSNEMKYARGDSAAYHQKREAMPI